MMESAAPLLAIVDTISDGRFDLIVFPDGILAVTGTYLGVALRAAGAGMVGAGGAGIPGAAAAGAGVASGWLAGRGYEGNRLAKLLTRPRTEILEYDDSNHFIPAGDIDRLVLRKRWHGHSLTVITRRQPTGRAYRWKPALNNFTQVKEALSAQFNNALTVE